MAIDTLTPTAEELADELLSFLSENDCEDVPDRLPGGITIWEYMGEKDCSYHRATRKLKDLEARGLLASRIEYDRAVMRRVRVWRKRVTHQDGV